MAVSDIPILSMLRTRMHWHQERHRILAENVANSDTPHFRPRDLAQPIFDKSAMRPPPAMVLARTDPDHLGGSGGTQASSFREERGERFKVRPGGNAVSLEDQVMKVAANQMDYQAATTLYGRSLALLKTAVGKR